MKALIFLNRQRRDKKKAAPKHRLFYLVGPLDQANRKSLASI
jgi:hypothetical protein